MHDWGDEWFDKYGGDLDTAVHHYWWWLYYFAGMWTYTKEQYGTLRLQHFWLGDIHLSCIYHDRWKWYLCKCSKYIPGLYKYQRLIFNIITLRAIKKWPHIKEEIMFEPDFDDLLYGWVKRKVGYICEWETF